MLYVHDAKEAAIDSNLPLPNIPSETGNGIENPKVLPLPKIINSKKFSGSCQWDEDENWHNNFPICDKWRDISTEY